MKATLTVNGQAVTFEGDTDEVAEAIRKLTAQAGGNGAAPADTDTWTLEKARRLVRQVQDDALRMLSIIARDAPSANIDGLRQEMGLKTAGEATGRLSSIGFARRTLNLPRVYRARPRTRTYEMLPEVAELFRQATAEELKRRGIS